MVLYRIGEIIYKSYNNIIFESQGVGYSLVVPQHERFEAKTKTKLYIHEIKNEYYQITYAFKDFKERLLFIDLISLQGVGPKVAFNLINIGWELLGKYIANGNTSAINSIPYINSKVAKLVVSELQDKWSKMLNISKDEQDSSAINSSNLLEMKDTLKMLGFKKGQIDKAVEKITPTGNVEEMIEEAIKLISNNYEQNVSTTA